MKSRIDKFINDQLSVWPEVSARFRALRDVSVKEMEVNGLAVILQHNPDRIGSTTAKVDAASINSRPCFLCPDNEPAEQRRLPFDGRKGRKYNIQINPFPIFPQHLVIASARHQEQSIWHHLVDMLDIVRHTPEFTVFYNGPESGASAPDHLHYQACPRSQMPLERAVDAVLDKVRILEEDDRRSGVGDELDYLVHLADAKLYHYTRFCRGIFVVRGRTSKSVAKLFYRLLESAPVIPGDKEPRINVFLWYTGSEYRVMTVFRSKHHSHHFDSTGEDHLTMAPGCADMAGFFIVPEEEDFSKLTPSLISGMLDEVTLSPGDEAETVWRLKRRQTKIDVGIMSAKSITFEIISDGAGPQNVTWEDGRISYNGVLYDELVFDAVTRSTLFSEPSFILYGVTIGVNFHWERKQNQTFAGQLRFIVEGDRITAINRVGIEDYLLSVISSEMKASSTLDLLKAHAVISRSWVMSQMEKRRAGRQNSETVAEKLSSGEIIRWWDHDDHTAFDVCADDHCQRYQGLTNAVGSNVRLAIDETWGQVLKYEGQLCDARFSKCCGGLTEQFSACWQDTDYPYLKVLSDTPGEKAGGRCFCDTSDDRILSQVLNDYDLESKDFFTWEVRYNRAYLSELVSRRSGVVFGEIKDLVPLERGGSGRIIRLKIVGSARTMVVGKELMIRRILSESHLKSSAFDVEWEGDEVILRGRGWGHGVGLCQIGAAVMSFEGYDYRQILEHYYPGTTIERK